MKDRDEDNWDKFKEYKIPGLSWLRRTDGTYTTNVGGQKWIIQGNDFPEEAMCTLIVNGKKVFNFNDWPTFWKRYS